MENKLMKILKLLFIIIFVLSMKNSTAQNQTVEQVFSKLSMKYNSNHFYMKQEVAFFDSHTSTVAKEREKTEIKYDNGKMYSKAFNQEKIIVDGLYVLVDHTSKLIMVDSISSREFVQSMRFDIGALGLLSYKKEIKEIDPKMSCISLYFKIGEHTKNEIFFNINDYTIEKIIFYYRESKQEEDKSGSPRIEINIIETDLDKLFSSNDFKYEQFITIENGVFSKQNSFEKYSFLNNIHE